MPKHKQAQGTKKQVVLEDNNKEVKGCKSKCVCRCRKALTGSYTIPVKAKILETAKDVDLTKIKKDANKKDGQQKAGAPRGLPRFEVSASAAKQSLRIE